MLMPQPQELEDAALDDEACGLALWEAAERPQGRSLSMLATLSQCNIGFAWHLHQLALARLLEHRVAHHSCLRSIICLQGRHGLAGGALASWICDRAADPGETGRLRDSLDTMRAPGLLVQTGSDWQALWLPWLDAHHALQWQCWQRDQLDVTDHPHPHGLDELGLFLITRRADAIASFENTLHASASRRLLTELLSLNALAQLAAAIGGVRHARLLAAECASVRRQGGAQIINHPAIRLLLGTSADALGAMPIALSGDPAAVRRFLLPVLRAQKRGEPQLFAFAITEPGAGSDAEDGHGARHYRPGVVARRTEGGWRLSGRKVFISGGDIAHSLAVFAALEDEGMQSWTCFLIQRDMPGFRAVRNELKMGMRASSASELEFDDVRVSDDHVIGGLRKGWALNRATLNTSRMPVDTIAVGLAQSATDIAFDFACHMRLGGRPLIHYQDVQLQLAQMLAETSAARALIWQSADTWTPRQASAAICKFHATDTAVRVADMAMAANTAGRELWGLPKFVTEIPFAFSAGQFRGAVLDPDDGSTICALRGSPGIGMPSPTLDLLLYSSVGGQPLHTTVNTRGHTRGFARGTMQLEIGTSNHPMAQTLRNLGLQGAVPLLFGLTPDFQSRLNAGVATGPATVRARPAHHSRRGSV